MRVTNEEEIRAFDENCKKFDKEFDNFIKEMIKKAKKQEEVKK